MLKVRLFGSGQAQYFDHFLPGFPDQQCCLILCYLLLNREQPHHREKLASVFWGDSSTQISRKNLRNNLWRLRQILQSSGAPPDEYLLAYEDSISFIKTSQYWLDVEVFEKISSEYQEIDANNLVNDQVLQLESAVNLYIGDLLESNYDDWCIYDRERFRLMYLGDLDKLLIYHANKGNYEQALNFGNRILAMDPTHERVHRDMMLMYWFSGDRKSALEQYHECHQIMRIEFGITPMEETRQLFEKIQSGQIPTSNSENITIQIAGEKTPNRKALVPIAKDALITLKRLQDSIDETRAEINQLEQLLNDALSGSDSA